MKIFITGATGYIGAAVARAAHEAGHQVQALAHRDEARNALAERGYEPLAGDLRDPGGLARLARGADAVVHAANTGGDDAAAVDAAATRALADALEGSGRPLVYTSGIWVLGPTGDRVADETSPTRPIEIVAWRQELEAWLAAAAERGVRTLLLRPAIVFGRDGGIPGMMGRGELPVVGDGDQRWPLVHVDDLAALYLAALESAPGGSVLHGVAGHATALEVARTLSDDEPERLPVDDARAGLGGFADALAIDQRVSARRTRELTGWSPERPWPAYRRSRLRSKKSEALRT